MDAVQQKYLIYRIDDGVNGFARHRGTASPYGGSYLARGYNQIPDQGCHHGGLGRRFIASASHRCVFFIQHCTDLSSLGAGNQFEGFEDESLVVCGLGLAYVRIVGVRMTKGAAERTVGAAGCVAFGHDA
jgi:hypothetical protein